MRYTYEGYLPNYPYHLISDEEMFEAFLPITKFYTNYRQELEINNTDWVNLLESSGQYYFIDNYPLVDKSLQPQYKLLVSDIVWHLKKYLSEEAYVIPDWVYSYLLNETIGPTSDVRERHDLLVALNVDNIEDEFTLAAANMCYKLSTIQVGRLPESERIHRPPTIFGDLGIIKYIAIQQLNARS